MGAMYKCVRQKCVEHARVKLNFTMATQSCASTQFPHSISVDIRTYVHVPVVAKRGALFKAEWHEKNQ